MGKKLNVSTWVFLAVVLICSVFIFFPAEDTDNSENRVKAPLPATFSAKFPVEFDAYYQDHFPFRSFLIRKFYTIRKSIKDNPKVIMGDQDWIFLNSAPFDTYAKVDNTVGAFTGKSLLNAEELAALRDSLAAQKKYFADRGASFLIMLPPNKMTVYGEYAPKAYRKLRAPKSQYEQTEEAAAEAGIPFINLKKVFYGAKGENLLYYKTDTHWNNYGAYLATAKLAEALGGTVPPVESILSDRVPCGDNFRMSGAAGECIDIHFEPLVSFSAPAVKCTQGINEGHLICANDAAPIKKRVVIARDSFTEKMLPYISRLFQRAILLWSGKVSDEEMFDIIEKEKPDYVIYNYAERNASKLNKELPAEEGSIK